MSKPNRFCQSCGMPMNKDPQGGGTEKNGQKTDLYCSYCYQKGKFLQPDLSVQEMQELCMHHLQKSGMPKMLAWVLTRNVPKLKRWRA